MTTGTDELTLVNKTCMASLQQSESGAFYIVAQGDQPTKKPEVEPEKLPDENPGIITEPKPDKGDDDDDDDDDDDYEPSFPEPGIGDDPDEIKTRTPIM